jgi:hypothetical protein
LDLDGIVAELVEERDRLNQAIALLSEASLPGVTRKTASSNAANSKPRRRGLTAAGRKRLSESMKKRWAERRKTASSNTANSKPRRRGMTAAGRKRLSELMKKRWAERRRKSS